jgi:hypothetical protein
MHLKNMSTPLGIVPVLISDSTALEKHKMKTIRQDCEKLISELKGLANKKLTDSSACENGLWNSVQASLVFNYSKCRF